MKICSKCKEKEGVHPFGRHHLCDDCRDFVEKTWKSKDGEVLITISEETRFGTSAYYTHGENKITLITEEGGTWAGIISHEVIHHVLNIRVSVQASYCYDNIDGSGQLHKELGLY